MPPELIFLPSWLPFNIYEFSSWARPTVVPLLLVLTRQPTCQVPEWANIDELYPQPRNETDYSLPKPRSRWGWARLLYHLDWIVGIYQKLPIHPFRSRAERRITQWVLDHQESDGSWAGIQPPWVYSLIALHDLALPSHKPFIDKGFNGFEGYAVEDEDTFTVQGCISPVWDTCLVQLALLESGLDGDDPMVARSARWLLDQQIQTSGDWQIRAKDTPPGGWAFEFHNNLYPDIDDASMVIIALLLSRLGPEEQARKEEAIQRGVDWLLGLQNKSGGWAAFDKGNTRGYMSQLPFSDFGESLDPPSADVTAHVVEMLGRLGYSRRHPILERAYQYLRQEQETEGSWFGRWGVNYIYGIGAVLPAMAAIGENMRQPYIRRAVDWLLAHQNGDGGWGESCASYVDPAFHGVGPSTASQTAWALLALLAAGEVKNAATQRGVNYLLESQTADGTWDEPYFTGTGFPGYGFGARPKKEPKSGDRSYQGLEMSAGFMINYHMYRNCWPLLALGRYRNQMTRRRNGHAAEPNRRFGVSPADPIPGNGDAPRLRSDGARSSRAAGTKGATAFNQGQ